MLCTITTAADEKNLSSFLLIKLVDTRGKKKYSNPNRTINNMTRKNMNRTTNVCKMHVVFISKYY